MRTDAVPSARSSFWALPLAAVIVGAAIAIDDPSSGVMFLLAGPVAIVALEHGPRGGLLAVAGAVALMPVVELAGERDPDVLGYLDGTGVYLFMGLLVGWMSDRMRAANVALGNTVRDEQDLSAAVLETVGSLVVVFEQTGRVVSFNRACETASGYRAHEVVGRTIYDLLLSPEAGTRMGEMFAVARPGDFPFVHESEWLARDGSRRQIAWTSTALLDANEQIRYLIGTGIDVTEKRALERRALEIDARLRAFFDHAPAILFWKDRESRFVVVNEECRRLFGVSHRKIVGRTPADFFSPEIAGRMRDADIEVLATGRPQTREHTLPGPEGERCVQTVTFPLTDSDRVVYGIGGIAVDTTDLVGARNELEMAGRETIARLARAVEFRDEATGDHIERMSELCERVARHLGLDDERCRFIRLASPMHDAGKIAVPDDVLLKPDKLSDDERAIMERHAEVGWALLRGSSSRVLEMAATIARTHHERFDGTGYPRALAGEDIPLEGRIAAVADVFDALTSDRVYRPAFTVERAIEMMRADRGTHFDPVVFDAFLAVLDAQD